MTKIINMGLTDDAWKIIVRALKHTEQREYMVLADYLESKIA